MLKSLDMVLKMDIETAAEPSSTDPVETKGSSQNKLFLKKKKKRKQTESSNVSSLHEQRQRINSLSSNGRKREHNEFSFYIHRT